MLAAAKTNLAALLLTYSHRLTLTQTLNEQKRMKDFTTYNLSHFLMSFSLHQDFVRELLGRIRGMRKLGAPQRKSF